MEKGNKKLLEQANAKEKLNIFQSIENEIEKAVLSILLDRIDELIDQVQELENMLVDQLVQNAQDAMDRADKEMLQTPEVQVVEFLTALDDGWADVRQWFSDAGFFPLDFKQDVNANSTQDNWKIWTVWYIEDAQWLRDIIDVITGGDDV